MMMDWEVKIHISIMYVFNTENRYFSSTLLKLPKQEKARYRNKFGLLSFFWSSKKTHVITDSRQKILKLVDFRYMQVELKHLGWMELMIGFWYNWMFGCFSAWSLQSYLTIKRSVSAITIGSGHIPSQSVKVDWLFISSASENSTF